MSQNDAEGSKMVEQTPTVMAMVGPAHQGRLGTPHKLMN
jgi:hypothetical protein